VPSWNMQPPAPRPPPPPRRVSGIIKAQMHSVPINPQPTIGDVGGGKVYGLNPITPPVAEHGATATSSTVAKEKSKGKRMVHTIEK